MMLKKRWLLSSALLLTLVLALSTLTGCVSGPPASAPLTTRTGCNAGQSNTCANKRLLVFSKTGAFRHASIKDGKIALAKLAAAHNFAIDFRDRKSVV